MKYGEVPVAAEDGASIAVRTFDPAAEPRGVVLILHGMAEHSARYEAAARALTAAGWTVWAYDHRGHGPAADAAGTLGHFADEDGWAKVLSDVGTVLRDARERHRGLPLCLFGHSMGSYVVQHHLVLRGEPVDAAVLSGTSAGGGPVVRAGLLLAKAERLRQGRRGKSRVVAHASFGAFNKAFEPVRTEYDWLSRDADQVDRYVADPLCGFLCTNQLWIDLLGALVELGSTPPLFRIPKDLPVYVFAGERDPVGQNGAGPRKVVDRYRMAGMRRVELRLYPEGRHEMLNETNAAEVQADLVAWLARVLPR